MYCSTETIYRWRASGRLSSLIVLQAPVLQYYDVDKPVTIQCDANGKELGAVLLQDNKPVCYASRALTDIETRYAPIETKMLAVVNFRFSQVSSVHLWQKCHNRDRS